MARKNVLHEPKTEWGKFLLAKRMATKGSKKPDGTHWPLDRLAFIEECINPFIDKAVTLWAYIRWETGKRTPTAAREMQVRAALSASRKAPKCKA